MSVIARWSFVLLLSAFLGLPALGWGQTVDLWYGTFHGSASGTPRHSKNNTVNNIVSFTTSGTLVSMSVLNDNTLEELRGFLVLPAGNLYAANSHTGNSRVIAFGPPAGSTSQRNGLGTFLTCDDTANPGLQDPFDVVIGPDQLSTWPAAREARSCATSSHRPDGPPKCSVFINLASRSINIQDKPEFIKLVTVPGGASGAAIAPSASIRWPGAASSACSSSVP